jgi:hypothetical protein
MENCIISAAIIAGKHFCLRLPVPNPRASRDAIVDKVPSYKESEIHSKHSVKRQNLKRRSVDEWF